MKQSTYPVIMEIEIKNTTHLITQCPEWLHGKDISNADENVKLV